MFLRRSEADESYARYASAILQVSIAANGETYCEIKEEGVMNDAVERLFHKEFQAKREEGIRVGLNEGRAEGAHQAQEGFVMKMLKAGELTLKKIAEYSGLTLAQVKAIQKSMA